ncbi:MAG: tetratricopeptide repeat protein [Spirochaetaceae bacterium]|jgi:Flp pilus assembly protein TadD|nr:tetratricopeptide repeat protein [Spirochaetaceae bacterium]
MDDEFIDFIQNRLAEEKRKEKKQNNSAVILDLLSRESDAAGENSGTSERQNNKPELVLNDADCWKRGVEHRNKGEYDKAIAEFTQAIQLKPDDAVYYNNRGVAYDKKGEYDKAIANYTQAINLKPDNADYYNNRGQAYLWEKDWQKADADFAMAKKLGYKWDNAISEQGKSAGNA